MAFSPEAVQTPSSPPPSAPRSAADSAPGHDDRNATPDPASRAAGDRPALAVVPSTSSAASLATARATTTEPGALPTPRPRASPRTQTSAEPARSRTDEAASRLVRAGVTHSLPASSPEHTRAPVDQRPAARTNRDGPAREAPIAQIETAAPPGASPEPAPPQAARAAAPAPTPVESIPPAVPEATPGARSEALVPTPPFEVSPSARAIEPRPPERRSPMPEPLAAPRVHIGRLEVIVVAPSQPPARPAQRSSADVASRRYLRNA
jgi:hypothetical protein